MSEIDDREKLKRRESTVSLRSRQEIDDLGFVMSSTQGRRFVHHVLDLCGIMKLSYSGPGKAEETAFYEGQRNVGNNIFRLIVKNFKKEWLIMNDEAEEEIKKHA